MNKYCIASYTTIRVYFYHATLIFNLCTYIPAHNYSVCSYSCEYADLYNYKHVLQVYIFTHVVGTSFECRTMAEYLSKNRYLFQDLSYQKMRRYLVTYDVLTDEEQFQIDNCGSGQMGTVINNIVKHLYSNRTSKLKSFLQLLEEDGDPDFKKAAIRLG